MGSKLPADSESLAAVLARGDRRGSLEALRDSLAAAWDAAPPYSKAAIAARIQAVLTDLANLPVEKKVTRADELVARRKARRAAAAALSPASGEGH